MNLFNIFEDSDGTTKRDRFFFFQNISKIALKMQRNRLYILELKIKINLSLFHAKNPSEI